MRQEEVHIDSRSRFQKSHRLSCGIYAAFIGAFLIVAIGQFIFRHWAVGFGNLICAAGMTCCLRGEKLCYLSDATYRPGIKIYLVGYTLGMIGTYIMLRF